MDESQATKTSTPRATRWIPIQLTVALAYLFWLFLLERHTQHYITDAYDGAFEGIVAGFLADYQLPVLPTYFWQCCWTLFLLACGFLFFTRKRWVFLSAMGAATALVLMADRIYYHFFSSVISVSALGAAHQLWDVKHSVWGALDPLWVLAILAFSAFAGFGWLINRRTDLTMANLTQYTADKVTGLVLAALAFYAFHVAYYIPGRELVQRADGSLTIYDRKPANLGVRFTVPYQSSYRRFATTFGIYNFHLYNAWQSIAVQFHTEDMTEGDLVLLKKVFHGKKALNDRASPLHGIAGGRNVFLVSLESLGSFNLGTDIQGVTLTPFLNGLSESGLYWPHMVDNVKTGGTSDAEFSVLTGLLPDFRQMAAMGVMERTTLHAIPAHLRGLGYGTYSFHGNEASFWNRDINHPRLGIDHMHFQNAYQSKEILNLGLPDHVVYAGALETLAKAPGPFFAFIISMSNHHPYEGVPEGYRDLISLPDDAAETERLFEMTRYMDDALGTFFEHARQMGFWENSMFVLYGDHRPPLNESGTAALHGLTGVTFESARGNQIPLLIVLPGLETAIESARETALTTVGSLQDIFPTVLHLLGLEIPAGIYGTHLFVANGERDAMPLLKRGNSFVYNGICYTGDVTEPYRDDQGLVFFDAEDRILSTGPRAERLQQATEALLAHLLIFDHDAQRLLDDGEKAP